MPRRLGAEIKVLKGKSFQKNSLSQGWALYTTAQVNALDVVGTGKIADIGQTDTR